MGRKTRVGGRVPHPHLPHLTLEQVRVLRLFALLFLFSLLVLYAVFRSSRFQELLRIPTVSRDNVSVRDDEAFRRWIPTLERLYPKTLAATELHRIDDFGMAGRE